MTRRWLGIGSMAAVVLVGCGTMETHTTVEQVTNARVAVAAAENADAKHLSPESLRRAQDALAIAGDAYTNREYERAFSFAKQATLYARVARAQSETKQAEDRTQAAKAQYEDLRRQTEAAMITEAAAPAALTATARPGVPEPASPTAQPEGAGL
jgi:hypothetical protein